MSTFTPCPELGTLTINTSDVYNADVYRVNNRWQKRGKCRCFGEIKNWKTPQLCSSDQASMKGTAGVMYNLIPAALKV